MSLDYPVTYVPGLYPRLPNVVCNRQTDRCSRCARVVRSRPRLNSGVRQQTSYRIQQWPGNLPIHLLRESRVHLGRGD